ncbi:Chaperone J-domain superfamily [Sesbania bispinosa]|nr:Chaperone J-domain superfamily [Sesbania bispinosa]
MDESCRTGMASMRGLPRRRSVEDRSSHRRRPSIFSGSGVAHSESVDADDFADVFGGPPRTLLAHKFSNSGSFYEEIFRPPEFISPAPKGGRTLPVFRIPAKHEGFYSDIFGSDDDRKSRERSGSLSKANSSSLSSEEISPRRPAIGDDVALAGFASKLRSNLLTLDDGVVTCCMPINVPWRWNSSTMMPEECPKINSNLRREDCEASAVDEAIAWAKEKFQSRSSDEESSVRNDGNEQTVEIEGGPDASENFDEGIGRFQPPEKLQTDTEKLDRDVRLWSSGKETDIRLLLSTLHHILWPESGWYAIPLMNLIESSQVKKAYQKARLCLHPDKLQQKGATLLQKQ